MPHITIGPKRNPPVRMRVIDFCWLDSVLDTLRRDRHDRREVRHRLWLLAFVAVAMVAYIGFYATR